MFVSNLRPYPISDRNTCEVDFVIDVGNKAIPVEVKAEENLKAKSLKSYRDRFSPEISVRTSMADYRQDDRFINLPLYMIEEIV